MKKIVAIVGHKHTKKDWLGYKLAENSDVNYIRPYVGLDLPKGVEPEEFGDYHIVLPQVLDDMVRSEEVLYSVEIEGRDYVYFKFQMNAPYNVLITDDYGVIALQDSWDGELYTIFVTSKNQKPSKRVGEYLTPSEFDEVFDVDVDDIDELEARIV